jgi:DeoR/GlpR family transcriptional regulator of sugar metabolism
MSRDVRRRRAAIVELAATQGLANVEELSRRFEVTPSTIRRDLSALEEEGQLARTYGGARALVAHPEADLRQRLGEAHEAKRAIGRWAAGQIQPGETVFLDAGTTTAALAHELRSFDRLTVVTTGLPILQELSAGTEVEVECLGGTLRQLSQAFVGPAAEAALERRTFDRVFLGADGVNAEAGICEAEPRQTRLKELTARRAEHVYVLAHAAKLGRRPFHAWAPLPPRWTLVTDGSASEKELVPFRERGVEVVVVDASPQWDTDAQLSAS